MSLVGLYYLKKCLSIKSVFHHNWKKSVKRENMYVLIHACCETSQLLLHGKSEV